MSQNETITLYQNPLSLQRNMLQRFQSDSGKVIVDPNNVLSYTLGMFSDLTAEAINEIVDITTGLYPVRAQVSEDLYKHMSDYDYVNMFASPAMCQLQLTLDKLYVLENAIDVNTSYAKLMIPKDTRIIVGGYVFGLYYPIEIRVNKATKTFTVVQDVSEINPIHTLTKNILEHRFYKNDQVELIAIQIPAYQFKRVIYSDELVSGTGFSKKYAYEDKFYAVRVFASVQDSKDDTLYTRQEIHQSLSNEIYNPDEPTVIVQVISEMNQVKLTIPQIYFTEAKIRGKIEIELLSTNGAIDFTIPVNSQEDIRFEFASDNLTEEETTYSTPLRGSPVFTLLPLSTKVSGGTNGYGFQELRDRVVNDTFSATTPITPGDVETFFKDKGMIVTKYRDGITDRVFLCHQKITDGDSGAVISAGSLNTYLDSKQIAGVPGIIDHNNGQYTITPSTLFEYDEEKGSCVPLTKSEIDRINSIADKKTYIKEFNDRSLTILPFHVFVNLADQPVLANSYDLRSPKVEANEFIGENLALISQLSLYYFEIVHELEGDNAGYHMRFYVTRTDDLKDTAATKGTGNNMTKNFRVLVTTDTVYSKSVWAEADYVGRDDNLDIFELVIKSSYRMGQIDGRHMIYTEDTFRDTEGMVNQAIYLDSKFHVVFTIRKSMLTILEGTPKEIETSLPPSWSEDYAVSEQRLTITLGSAVSELWNKVTLAYQGKDFKRYTTTKFATLKQPVYERGEDGSIQYEVGEDGKIILKKAFEIGQLAMYAVGEYPKMVVSDAFVADLGDEALINGVFAPLKKYDPETEEEKYMEIAALSRQTDIWAMDKSFTSGKDKIVQSYQIRTADALTVALDCCASVPLYKNLPATGTDNQFVFVNDALYVDDVTPNRQVPTVYGDVRTAGADPLAESRARLFLWTGSEWTAMISALDMDDLREAIRIRNEASIWNGLAYVIYMAESKNDIDQPEILQYVSFLTTGPAVTRGTTVVGTETQFPSFATKVTTTTSEGDVEEDLNWELHINKWPWDATDWMRTSKGTLRYIMSNGQETTREYLDLIEDTTITFSLNSAGLGSYIDYVSGQVILDANGEPIIDSSSEASTVYLITAPHIDAKLRAATTTTYTSYPSKVCDVFRNYFDIVAEVKNEMMENTRLFFEPLRSIGTGTFKDAAGNEVELPLDVTMAIRVYVTPAAAEDIQLIDALKAQIVKIIDEQISNGVVSCLEIATILKETVPDVVQYIDVLGINDDPNLQTLICVEENVRPHLKHELVVLEDGTIDVNRGLHLELVVAE